MNQPANHPDGNAAVVKQLRNRNLILLILTALVGVLIGVVVCAVVRGICGDSAAVAPAAPEPEATTAPAPEPTPEPEVAAEPEATTEPPAADPFAGVQAPRHTLPGGGILVGPGGVAGGAINPAVPTVEVFADYLCPFCYQFEFLHAETLASYYDGGEANLIFYLVAGVGGDETVRMSAATAWVIDLAPEHFFAFHEAIYDYIFAEESRRVASNDTLAEIALAVGVPADVAAGIESGEAAAAFSPWVEASSLAFFTAPGLAGPDGGRGTPTIVINGQRWFGGWTTDTEALGRDVAASAPAGN
ncbi:MAG: DsbA family protein [Promicromonosporaceae bacterium]|nr:DsbA family protein [Promicromonosporaceae bacterium]